MASALTRRVRKLEYVKEAMVHQKQALASRTKRELTPEWWAKFELCLTDMFARYPMSEEHVAAMQGYLNNRRDVDLEKR